MVAKAKIIPTEDIQSNWNKIKDHPAVKDWADRGFKGQLPSNYRKGFSEFLLLHKLSVDDFLEIHKKWVNSKTTKCPTVNLMDDYAAYLMEVAEKQRIPSKRSRRTEPGQARTTSSTMYTGPRSCISHQFGRRNGIPCVNLPSYKTPETRTYKPKPSEVGELMEAADGIVEEFTIIASYQMPVGGDDLTNMKYTAEIARQEKEIEAGKRPPVLEWWYNRGKVKGKNIGVRPLVIFDDGYKCFKRYKEKVNLVVGDPFFKGYGGTAYEESSLREHFNKAARIIKLQERVGDLKKGGQDVRWYGLRGAGIREWNKFDKLMGDYMAGHVLRGVGEFYYDENQIFEAIQEVGAGLNPKTSERQKFMSFEEKVTKTGEDSEALKAQVSMLTQMVQDLGAQLAEVRKAQSGGAAEAFKKEVKVPAEG